MLRVSGARSSWDYRDLSNGPAEILIRDGVLTDGYPVGPSDAAAEWTNLDASGCVITPGLVNAHHHMFQTAFRTIPATRGVPMSQWLPEMGKAYAEVGITASAVRLAARAAIAESLLSGVTTVADHHLTWPADTDGVELARATESAARELGIRLVFVRGSAGDPAEAVADSVDAIADALAPDFGGLSGDGMIQVAAGPAGVHSDGEETFRRVGEVAARRGLRRRTQANEVIDVERSAARYGARPIELLDRWGWLAPDVTLAHLCDVTDAEIALLAERQVAATHAPGCDVAMGWGIAPMRRMLGAGIRVGLGTSGGGSNDAGHLLADARLAMQVSALVGEQVPARAALDAATRGSALGLGRPELGSLAQGSRADLAIWDVSGVADAGVADPIAGLLWANPGRRPRHVIVDGRIVVKDYRLVSADEHAIAADLSRFLKLDGATGHQPRRESA
ncbi:amidohydrolase family protein [uncultured Microbacterium sp.]|uniref:amidohydrolase family protein n=1 Tax=uncultured Microbacterium sp. TaxID=191216 RepID=UPI0035CA9002